MSIVDELVAYNRIAQLEKKAIDESTVTRDCGLFVAKAYVLDEEIELKASGPTPFDAMRRLAREIRLFMQGDYSITTAIQDRVNETFLSDFGVKKN